MSDHLPSHRGPLANQTIRAVGARELRQRTADVIRSVGRGQRTILTRHGVVLASGAARLFQRMNPRDRANLRSALVRARADEERLMWLRSGLWLVLFSYPDAETVLVCAVFDARELERELVG